MASKKKKDYIIPMCSINEKAKENRKKKPENQRPAFL